MPTHGPNALSFLRRAGAAASVAQLCNFVLLNTRHDCSSKSMLLRSLYGCTDHLTLLLLVEHLSLLL